MAESSNKYVLREFMTQDYSQYASWFDDAPTWSNLPTIGLVSGDMKAVGFLYKTDSDFCIIAFWHANPKNKAKETYAALREIIAGLCNAGKLIGKKNVFITTTNRGMIRLLKSMGFYNADGAQI